MNSDQRFLTITWIALGAAVILPPIGLVLGIIAAVKSRSLPNRPGNKAVAFSAIGVAAIMSFMFFSMLLSLFMYRAQAEEMELEYQRAVQEQVMIENDMQSEHLRLEQEAQKVLLEAEKALQEAERAQREADRIAPPSID